MFRLSLLFLLRRYPLLFAIATAVGLGCAGGEQGAVGAASEADVRAEDALPFLVCVAADECQDGNLCTKGLCIEGICQLEAVPGVPCEDGDLCTENDRCDEFGSCARGTVVLPPSLPCAQCSCDPLQGIVCEPSDPGAVCDDGDCCVYDSTCVECDPEDTGCNPVGRQCVGTRDDCNDDDPCTEDLCGCDEGLKSCTQSPAQDGTACSYSENDCTVGDHCMEGVCASGPPIDLDDDNPCTKDLCIKGSVEHEPLLEGQCDDGDNCTTEDFCFLGSCVGGDLVECVVSQCASSASCVSGEGCVSVDKPAGAACNDGDPCSINEACDGQGACESAGEQLCDDLNPCTDDSCDPDLGCVSQPNNLGCDDGDVCTVDDICTAGFCAGESDLVTDVGFDCTQVNGLDGDGCGETADPTGEYEGAQILDLGKIHEGKSLNCCVSPGLPDGGVGFAYVHTSVDGQSWSESKLFLATSNQQEDGSWEPYCTDISPQGAFRYVRGAHNSCSVNFFSCSLQCLDLVEPCGVGGEICDDGNACTIDECDVETGACSYTPTESPTCMKFGHGNNLVSFGILPADPTLGNVLGDIEPYVDYLIGEGTLAFRLSNGEWGGNLTHIERDAGYWIYLDLPTGQKNAMLELKGTPTDPDIKYALHKGSNSISFAGVTPTPVPDGLSEAFESFFSILIGQGVATIPKNGGWVGNLLKLQVNHGYEVIVTDAISDFRFDCLDCDGVDPYAYGCRKPQASNYSPAADVDDGSCEYELPSDWVLPQWSDQKHQRFIIFDQLYVSGAPAQPKDAMGAFIAGTNVGFGFPSGQHTVVPVMNQSLGDAIEFKVFDKSSMVLDEITVVPEITWDIGGWVIVGCTDPTAANYSPFATHSANYCIPLP